MKKIFLLLTLLNFTLSCKAQKENHKQVKSITVNCDKIIITYKNKGTKVIYNDSIGRAVYRIITKNAKESLKDTLINSLSIGLYINGVTFTEHFGELDNGKNNTANDNTIYEIASVTKTFTGTLAAKAVLEGKIKLEDDIRKYLPKEYNNLQYKGNSIRFKHLLTHTSGLPANNKDAENSPPDLSEDERSNYFYANEKRQTKKMFFDYLLEIKLDTLSGTKFNYSNYGTNLTAYILEKVYNKPFQELIKTEIIDKANMTKTKFHLNNEDYKLLANGYNGNGKQMPHLSLDLAKTLWGAEGGLKSTIPDMLNYIRYQINEQNQTVVEAHKKLYEINTDYWIGYFWWIINNNGNDFHFRHDGGALGTRNVLLIYPEAKIGITIFTNVATEGVFENLSKLSRNIYEDLKEAE